MHRLQWETPYSVCLKRTKSFEIFFDFRREFVPYLNSFNFSVFIFQFTQKKIRISKIQNVTL
ncbi:hypothetical protein CH380_11585 [Leptospira adleri]|uniref:Uncharacterized protein n=1 Tax=Leptospira adleri TaxID=2023186 RepID=A0A2M9YNF4_9LEPT|nr:hypothetical protein CH380_11585 [Leptospira adleri]PJZ62610.1 hypothetical protein CH376_07365 [Leptospira adleri]